VVLAGESDLTFIVEHLCAKYGLGFEQRSEAHTIQYGPDGGSSFTLFSETVDPPENASRAAEVSGASCVYLRQVLID
jgi:hypothetical protein